MQSTTCSSLLLLRLTTTDNNEAEKVIKHATRSTGFTWQLTDGKRIGRIWVAFFFFKNICYYFDSFGAPPPVEIINFIKKEKGSHLLFNNYIIQNIKSSNCGYFSLAFLLYMYANRQKSNLKEVFNEFVNNFADDTTKNDDILKSFFASSHLSSSPSILKKFIKD